MEDALREPILRYTDCQLVTVPFSENPLDFQGKSVPNCPQIYEFSRSPHEATHYTEWLHLRLYQGIRKMPRWRLWIIQRGTNKFFRSFIWFLRSFISPPRGGFSFFHLGIFFSNGRSDSSQRGGSLSGSWVREWYLLLGRFVGAFPW